MTPRSPALLWSGLRPRASNGLSAARGSDHAPTNRAGSLDRRGSLHDSVTPSALDKRDPQPLTRPGRPGERYLAPGFASETQKVGGSRRRSQLLTGSDRLTPSLVSALETAGAFSSRLSSMSSNKSRACTPASPTARGGGSRSCRRRAQTRFGVIQSGPPAGQARRRPWAIRARPLQARPVPPHLDVDPLGRPRGGVAKSTTQAGGFLLGVGIQILRQLTWSTAARLAAGAAG